MEGEDKARNDKPEKKNGKKGLILLLILLLLIVAAGGTAAAVYFTGQRGGQQQAEKSEQELWLIQRLADASVSEIEINDTIEVTEPLTVTGAKTLTGSGTIIYKGEASAWSNKSLSIPEDECEALHFGELSELSALFTVKDGGSLTVAGSVTLDGGKAAMVAAVEKNGALTVSEEAVLKNGLGANVVNDGTASVKGGTLEAADGYNIVNHAVLNLEGGTVTGSGDRLMAVLTSGEVVLSGSTVKNEAGTGVYQTEGTFTMTGGILDSALIDNVYIGGGKASVTGGTITYGDHGIHNAAEAVVTGGSYEFNGHQIHNEGTMELTGVTFATSTQHSVVNTGEKAKMTVKDVVVKSATVHAFYNVRGAVMDAENITVESAMAKGIHNGGGHFTGKNITVIRAQGAGVGNDIEKGWVEDGDVTIDGLTVMKATNYNLLNTTGTMTITNAELYPISSNSVQVSGGTVNLTDVEVQGTIGSGTFHGFYIFGGTVNATNVNIGSTVSRGIQNRGGVFNGENITVADSKGTAIGNMTGLDGITEGTINIDGLKVTGAVGYSLQNTNGGTINIKNGTLEVDNTTGVRIDDGKISLTNVQIIGTGSKEKSANLYNGITAMGGTVALNNVTVKDMLGRGISNDGATITGTNVKVTGANGTSVCNLSGAMSLTKLTTSDSTGYNLDSQGGELTVTDGMLGSAKTTSVRIKDGKLSLIDTVVNGAPKITEEDGTVNQYNGITATGGALSLKNVVIQDTAGRNLNVSEAAAVVTGEQVTLSNPGGTSLYNKGTVTITGLSVKDNSAGYEVDNYGTLTLTDATFAPAVTTNINMQPDSVTVLNNVTVEGGTKSGNAVYVRENAKLTFDGLTINNAVARGLSNGNSSGDVKGGTVVGKNLKVTGAGSTSVANDSGTMEIDGLTIEDPGANCAAVKSGTMTLKNATLGVAPNTSVNVTGGKVNLINTVIAGTTAENGITVNGGDAYLEDVTISNVAARNLNVSNEESTVAAKNVTLLKDGQAGTTLYNKGTVAIDGFTIENTTTGYQVDNFGTLTLQAGTLGYGGNTNLALEADSDTKLYDVTVKGTSSGNAVYVKAATASLTFDGLTIENAKARALSNGNGANTPGGTVNGKNLTVIQTSSSTAVSNDYGTMDLENVKISGAAYHFANTGTAVVKGLTSTGATRVVNNTAGTLTMTGLAVEGCTNIGVNNTAEMALEDYAISGSYSDNGLIVNTKTMSLGSGTVTNVSGNGIANSGTLKQDGELTVTAKGGNGIVNNGTMTQNGAVKAVGENALYQNGVYTMTGNASLVSEAPVYLIGGHVLELPDGKLANTAEQKILLNAEVTEVGTVLVNAKDEALAAALLELFDSVSNGLFTIESQGSSIVTGEAEIQYENVHVSTWAEFKTAIEGAEADSQIRIILDKDITATAEGSITVGQNGAMLLLLTDEGKGYTITRNTADALFTVAASGVMTIDGSLTVDGGNTNGVTAEVALIINRGTLTVGEDVVITNAVNTSSNNSINGSGLSGGAIESGGILNIYGTVTASKSGNGTAVSVIGGTLTVEGADLSSNLGRALRIGVNATATIADSHFDNNSGASGGGALLVDAATVTVTGSSFDNNVSTGSGGSIQLTNAASVVTLTGCSVDNNTSKTNGGAFWVGGAGAKLTFIDCTVRNNKNTNSSVHGGAVFLNTKATLEAVNTEFSGNRATGSGGMVYVNADGAVIDLTKCVIKDNTSGASGGAICLTKRADVTMTECTVTGNTAGGTGSAGVIFVNAASSTVLFKDCTINENHADGGYGGVSNINAVATVTMDGGEMIGNTAKYGGAMSIGSGAGKNFIFKSGRIGDNSATDLGTQIRFGGTAGQLQLGSDALIYVTDKESDAYKNGMLGLAGAGADIALSGALNEASDITVKSTSANFKAGVTVLSGYDASNAQAELNTWITGAAFRITIVSPAGLYVGTDGKVTGTAPTAAATTALSEGGVATAVALMAKASLSVCA